jgi:Protein of unknown function (DUF3352)
MTGASREDHVDQDQTQRYEAPPAEELTPPTPTMPVAPPAAAPRTGRSRLRWLIALVVVALVAGTAAGATLLLTADSGDPEVLAWVPADSVMYGELRLDLPGGQQAELAKFLSAFPGLDDQAAFDQKLGEVFDRLVEAASDGKHDYRTEIDPWFGGQIAVATGPGPTAADIEAGRFQTRTLVLAKVDDATKATAWTEKILGESGADYRTETYAGTELTLITPKTEFEGIQIPTMGYAVLGPVLAIGDETSLKAAIDTKGANGLAKNEQFRTAVKSVSGDRLAFLYSDTTASLASSFSMIGDNDPTGMAGALLGLYEKLVPRWSAMALRAADGRLVAEAVSPHVEAMGPASNHASAIAALAPADTVFLATGHDLGDKLARVYAILEAEPKLADGMKQVEQTLGVLGGYEAITGWMGDAGIAITRNGNAVDGGLIVVPTDRAAAERLFTLIKSLVTLAGGQSGITFREETYGDATIQVADLSGAIPEGAEVFGTPALPSDLALAWTVTDQAVVLGVGTDFVKAVLDARTGDSLAKQPRFTALLDAAGKEHGSLSWLDIAGVRELVEGLIPERERAMYDSDVKPYLEPLDAMFTSTVSGADVDRSTILFTVTP